MSLGRNEIAIGLVAEWDHSKVPLVWTSPKFPSSMVQHWVPLKSGYVVSQFDPEGFARIVSEAFPNPTLEDGRVLAHLAALFGKFDGGGQIIERDPGVDDVELPRKSFAVAARKDGGALLIEFYSYIHQVGRLYDHQVRIEGGKAQLSSRWLNAPKVE